MRRQRFLPYLLLLPTLLYLALFFAYPMLESFQLAFQRDVQYLNLRAEAQEESAVTGTVAMQATLTVVDRVRSEEVLANGVRRPIYWFNVEAESISGDTVRGWVNQRNIFIESRTESTTARVTTGENAREWTLDYVKRMVEDFRFGRAILTTALLIVLILPLQFTLAIIMALILQTRIRGNTLYLYIYALPLGISDLASGLLWYGFFTQRGFINSFLVSVGILDQPFIFLRPEQQGWIIVAIVLAEVWRATSIVMVIVVSGLQAIPQDYLEAGEVFGASVWQRIRFLVLPLLRPSLQVALILRTILAMQVFAVVIALSGGDLITVLANETYRWYDPARFNSPNMAAAYAGFILIVSLGISLLYLRAVRSQEEAASQA